MRFRWKHLWIGVLVGWAAGVAGADAQETAQSNDVFESPESLVRGLYAAVSFHPRPLTGRTGFGLVAARKTALRGRRKHRIPGLDGLGGPSYQGFGIGSYPSYFERLP